MSSSDCVVSSVYVKILHNSFLCKCIVSLRHADALSSYSCDKDGHPLSNNSIIGGEEYVHR